MNDPISVIQPPAPVPAPLKKKPVKKTPTFHWVFFTFVITALVVGGSGYYFWMQSQVDIADQGGPLGGHAGKGAEAESDVAKFASADDFRSWLARGGAGQMSGGYALGGMVRGEMAVDAAVPAPTMGLGLKSEALAPSSAGQGAEPSRVSETNVQVAGIDEPDIVKTDGHEIYYSPEQYYWWGWAEPVPMMRADAIGGSTGTESIMPPRPSRPPGVRAIKAFPPADLKLDGQLDRTGDLLLAGKTLMVFSNDGIRGYDVSDPAVQAQKWSLDLQNNHQIVSSRLYRDKVYVVARAAINDLRPCPIVPMKSGDAPISIPCDGIYHPIRPTPSDVTYSVLEVDAATGKVERSASFVGSQAATTVYMSEKYLYVTHPLATDQVRFFIGFLKASPDLAPADIIARLEKLDGYELSSYAKEVELQAILEQWRSALSQDEQLKMENEMNNKLSAYYKDHRREIERTGIVRVAVDGLTVAGTGEVPGSLLNQFSIDEYGSYLRLATTTGGRGGLGWQFGLGQVESANDVYTLGPDLAPTGSVLDLGKGERIYSVRFLEDKGYVVTFKETDPFFVIDLSDPKSPQLKGELQLPGYSAYLHPITKDKVLGIGREGSQVKVSLFDVSDPAKPVEKAKYLLDEYWSDILNTHHAFLLDAAHNVFFLPGGKGGYVFDYSGDQLKLAKAVSGLAAKRALYIDDYLYVLGDSRIVVVNEKDWQNVNQLDLPGWNQ